MGIVTLGGGTVTVTVLVLARVDGVVGGVDGPTGTPGMISVEVTVVLVLEVGCDGGGDSSEQALAPRATAATDTTTMDLNMIAECPFIRTGKPGQTQNCPLPEERGSFVVRDIRGAR
ncbi:MULTISPECIES: hypothetical protein [unclassified Mycolicibacterium]|uniref:hypothetical protein n=1 Tax=unclassified Mycolicibacterium TaxID=2636767 RepID=UPI001BB30CCB|nr:MULTISPECIES: hypothetical protein [unclassified Mycolicibacterium]